MCSPSVCHVSPVKQYCEIAAQSAFKCYNFLSLATSAFPTGLQALWWNVQ
jgi:hypothetical protein